MALHIRGTVAEQGAPAVRLVRLYLRSSGELLAEEYSDSDGEFQFIALSDFAEGVEFYVVCLDDDGGEAYNALIYDRVTPQTFAPGGAHRYWRITGIDIPGGTHLEISELRLFADAIDVTGDATISATHATSFGVVTSLVDNNLTTRCHWTAATAEGATFAIVFDFGFEGDIAIDGVKQGGFDNSTRYMQAFSVEYSDDGGEWTPFASESGLTYPGNNTLSALYDLLS